MAIDGIDTLGAELERILTAAEHWLQEHAESAGERMDATGEHARESLRRACGHLRAAQKELGMRARRADAAVRRHPWETIALVGAAAYLLGRWSRRP